MVLCTIDLLCIVCVLQKRNKGIDPKNITKQTATTENRDQTLVATIEFLVLEQGCLRRSSQYFLAKNLVKSLLISTLDKVIYYKGAFLQGSTKPRFKTQDRLETR
jgi:hypothetical protein